MSTGETDTSSWSGAATETTFGDGRYVPLRVLGAGGQKVVYLAHDMELDRDCAVAVLLDDAMDDDAVARLRREAQAMARLGAHANVVTVFDLGVHDGRPYIVCEYVPGGDLRRELHQAGGVLPVGRALQVTADLLRALAFAHEHGIVHRDVKPDNVWLTASRSAKLGDFGIAQLPRREAHDRGRLVGTPQYMSPEQLRGEAIDGRSDLYAVGCMLFELLTGTPPFTGALPAIVSKHLEHTPPTPSRAGRNGGDIPPAVDVLVATLLAKSPADRPASASVAIELLEAAGASVASNVPSHDSSASGRRSRFVGRTAEMKQLLEVLSHVCAGGGALRAIAGEAGIGKSRVTFELATAARGRGMLVLRGACTDAEGAPPYLPFVEAMSTALGKLPSDELRARLGAAAPLLTSEAAPRAGVGSLEAERYALLQAATSLLRELASPKGLLLVLEDLHWADKPTLLLLQHLARQLEGTRILVCATYRDVEIGKGHVLGEVLDDLRRQPTFARVALKGLAPADVTSLVAEAARARVPEGLVDAVLASTEGNPFFVEELVKHLEEEGKLERSRVTGEDLGIPEGVRAVVGRRLARLSEACNQMLVRAAAMRGSFAWGVLAVVAEKDEETLLDALDEALAARVVREVPDEPGVYEFTHALIRQTLYESLSGPRRARLHRRIGEAMERVHGARVDRHLAELSFHFVEASKTGDADKALHYSTRAGEQATALLAYEDAAAHYGRALDALARVHVSSEGHAARARELHARRGRVYASLGVWSLARDDFEAALSATTVQEERAGLLVELSRALHWLFETARQRTTATEARDLARQLGRKDLEAAGLAWLGVTALHAGALVESLHHYEAAAAVAGAAHNPDVTYFEPLVLLLTNRYADACARSERAVDEARRANDAPAQMVALPHRGLALAAVGRYTEAMTVFAEAARVGERYGIRTLGVRALAMSGGFLGDLHDLATARRIAEQARETALGLGFFPSVVSADLDLLFYAARSHDTSRVDPLLAEVNEHLVKGKGAHVWIWLTRLALARAELALEHGDVDEAMRRADDTLAQLGELRARYRVRALIVRARALASSGRTKEALAELDHALAAARTTIDPALRIRAIAARLAIDGADDIVEDGRRAVATVLSSLPQGETRERFVTSEAVRRITA